MFRVSNFLVVFATLSPFLFLGLVGGAAIESQTNDKLTVRIDGLGAIRGKTERTAEDIFGFRRDFLSFTGIPYGKNPVRFSPAEMRVPLTSSENEVFDATQPQVACWQALAPPLVPGPFSEDCLSLNIYTPKLPQGNSKLLPVIFFIHGGSFVRWSGNMFGGTRLLNKDVIVVSINYRLNVFGFFCTENDDQPGNLALYDQLLALKWVNRFISNFGGDPNRVTIAGQSAGGASVTYLLDSPIAAGLFQAAITSSGDDLAGWALQAQPLQNSLNAAAVMGCYNPTAATHDLTATLSCLRAIPPATLMQANVAFYSAPSVQNFNLSIPKITPMSPYASLVTTGMHTQVPLIIGTNKNDGSLMLSRTYAALQPSGLLNNTEYMKNQFVANLLKSTSFGMTDTPLGILDTVINTYLGKSKNTGVWHDIAPGLVDIYSVFYFKSAAFTTAKAHSAASDTWLYSFDYEGGQSIYTATGGVPQVPKGVTHIDDLMYLFYFGDFTGIQDKLVSSKMVDYWFNFANTLNPNGKSSLQSWPKFTVGGGKFYKIKTLPSVGSDYVDYWVGASQW